MIKRKDVLSRSFQATVSMGWGGGLMNGGGQVPVYDDIEITS